MWADYVIKGMITDPTQGATNYFADSIAPPNWVDGATFTVQIGHHKFYKNVD